MQKEIIRSIVAYLTKQQQQQEGAVSDPESLGVAVQMIRDLYGLQADDDDNSSNKDVVDLEHLFAERSSNSSSSLADKTAKSVDEDPKFLEFIQLLTQKGYFKDVTEGSAQWKDRYEKARQRFLQRNAAAAASASASGGDKDAAEKFKEQGNDLLRKKQFKEAVAMYEKAIEINPKNHVYHTNMAAAYVQLRDYDAALSSCKAALEINDRYAKAYKWMGQVYELTGMLEEALDSYEQAVKLEPDVAEYGRRVDEVRQKMQQQQQQFQDPMAAMLGGGIGGANNPFAGLLGGGGGGIGGAQGGGMPDLGALFNNPQVMQMAQQIMENPMMRQMAANMARSMGVDMEEDGTPRFTDEQIDELANLEEVQQSEKLKQFVEDLRVNGLRIMDQYRDDPEVNEFMMKAAQQVFSSNPFLRDMFGGGVPGQDDSAGADDAPDSMYS